MIAHILDKRGFYLQTVNVQEGVKPKNSRTEALPEAWDKTTSLRWAGDSWEERQLSEVKPDVPQEVNLNQAKKRLIKDGVIDQVESALNAMPEGVAKQVAFADWNHSPVIRRGSELVFAVQTALSWPDEFLDDLFISASSEVP